MRSSLTLNIIRRFCHSKNADKQLVKELKTNMDDVKQIQAGYIVKEGSKVKSWKKRWFIFNSDGSLSYYSDRQVCSVNNTKTG